SFGVEQRATAPPPKELEGDFMSIETVKAAQGETATFGINVTMRQNTSWQGSIDWLDGSDPTDFISALEFIRIVHDAVIT
ncbi:MAG: hypothetical protein FWG06_02165, partial [Clostridiales bacterium]|nr:hypothetical protein [Clostridiales bacterium]